MDFEQFLMKYAYSSIDLKVNVGIICRLIKAFNCWLKNEMFLFNSTSRENIAVSYYLYNIILMIKIFAKGSDMDMIHS